MTKEEFEGFIADQKKGGKSEEDIVKIFSLMFQEEKLDREQYEAVLTALGYGLSEELKKMSDEELREEVIKTSETAKEGEDPDKGKVDPDGEPAPKADKSEDEAKEEEPKQESEPKAEEEEGSEEDEKKKAMGLFGLK